MHPDCAADAPARLLEVGLAALLVLAPLPFGAVGPPGRLALESGALVLLLVWLARSLVRRTPLPAPGVLAGLGGLLFLAALQAAPLGDAVVGAVSPRSVEIRRDSRPPERVAAAEERLLGRPAAALDLAASVSLDPAGTASALRTGCALAALLVVGHAVAALRGARGIALALLLSGGFQGLYGILVVASGHDRIWHLPKKHFLDDATGTFVNRNHFACLMAMSLACGAALLLAEIERRPPPGGSRLRRWLGAEGGSTLALALPLVVGLAGLLLSFSRAGIAIGLTALGATVWLARGPLPRRTRAAVLLLLVVAALVPLARLGPARLIERYRAAVVDLLPAGGRPTVWVDTLRIAADFPVAGCGFGSFAATYPLYRSPSVRVFYSHAHNDFVQALAEGGGVGLACLLLLAFRAGPQLAAALRGAKGTLGIGCAIGLAAILAHALVDFNFHLPANAATAAVLAGAVLGLPWIRRS